MITFKTPRIREEFTQLPKENKKLFDVLVDLEGFVRENYKKDVMLTSVLRTKEENDALYKHTPPEKRPKSQPHTTWEAVDLRSHIYTKDEIEAMLRFLNKRFTNANGKPTAIYHQVSGGAYHFHIGVQRL